MNFKKLFSTLVVLLLFVSAVSAQTFYVNNAFGNDANSGTGPGVGLAKATVSSALLAAPGGSTISVAFTGINYTEATPGMNLLPGPLTPGVTGTYTFVSTGGTPVFTNPFQVGTAATAGTITFTGPFQFNGLNLTRGTLAGGGNITITAAGAIYRSDLGSITSGQLLFAGTATFNYENTATAVNYNMNIGLEFPTATNVATTLTTTATFANITLVFADNRQINGLLTTGAGANNGGITLGTGVTLTISGGGFAHTIDGDVTGATGTLAFILTGAVSLDGVGPRAVTNITASAAAGNILTIDPAAGGSITTVTSLTSNTNATITANNTGNIGAVTLNGAATILTINNGVVGAVLGAAGNTGLITLGNAAGGGAGTSVVASIVQSGRGNINFDVDTDGAGADIGTTTISVTGAVLLNTAYTVVMAPGGILAGGFINFPDLPITSIGTVTNSASVTGATDQAYATAGNINFASAANPITVTGLVLNSSTGGYTTSGGGSVTSFGRITFATTAGALSFGSMTNSSTLNGVTSGDIIGTGGGVATINSGAVLNSSTVANANINFSVLTGTNTLASVTSSGATTGGDIRFGNGNVAVGGGTIANSRGAAGADIVFGTAGTDGITVTAATINNSGASLIDFVVTTTGAVSITADLTQTGSGTTRWPNTTTGTFTMRNVTVSGGTLFFGNGTGALAATGNVLLTNGTVNWGTGAAHTFAIGGGAGINTQFGGVGTVVTMSNGNNLTINFQQPVPNVNQTVTLSTINQSFNGKILVSNAAIIPAPYVIFKSADPANVLPGNLYILNTTGAGDALTFATPAPPANPQNSVQIDNARLYIGLNNPGGTAGGDFQNTSGYVTINGGFVMMNGNAAQRVNNTAAANVGATFGNFGVDNNGLAGALNADVAFINPCTFTGDFYLAEGSLANTLVGWAATTNVQFNGPAPYPTIYRTEGVFRSAPTFTSLVNVTYYGNDKAASFEIPVAGNRLQNLTVATTNGAQAGFGIVTMVGATTVNGTLTINANQSLYTAANNLTLNGASAVVNGYLVDDAVAGNNVFLNAVGGTTFSGNGFLPGITVNAGSLLNTVTGRGLVFNGFGGDGVWGGGNDDFTTTAGAMDGSIVFLGAGGLTATFSAPTGTPTTNFLNLTTAVGGTLTLGANAIMGGDMNHVGGVIDVSTFNLTHRGIAPSQTLGATIIGTGNLIFPTAATTFTGVTAPGPVILANVICNSAGSTFTLAGTNLRINGNLTLGTTTPTTTTLVNGGFNLTLGGSNVTFYGASAITGAGTTILVNTAPNTLLTWTVPAASAPAVTNLTVNGNVTLAGPASLTVNGVGSGFTMTSGTLTIGAAALNIGAAASATPFTYTAGTIVGTGFVVYNSTGAWTQGTPAGTVAAPLTLTNLQVDFDLNITGTPANTNLIGSTLTITGQLYLNGAVLTQTRTVATTGSLLNMNALTTMQVAGAGNIGNAAGQAVPVYAGLVNYLFTGAAATPNTFTWPTNQANNVTLNNAGANVDINPASNKVIAGTLTLTSGTLRWDAGTDVSMPTAGQKIIRNVNGDMTLNAGFVAPGTGTFTAPDINIDYTGFAAGPAVYNTSLEYSGPGIVRDVTLLAMVAPNQTMVAINSSRTIAGVLTLNSVLTFNAATTTNITLAQTIGATGTVNVLATAVVNWNGGLTYNGPLYTNSGTTSVTGTLIGTGNITNNNIMNLGGLNLTGASLLTLNGGSTVTLTGDGTIQGLTVPALGSNVFALISTANNLTFANVAWTGTNLNLTFTGTNTQTVALGQNRPLQNLTMNKTSDASVTFTQGNLILNVPTPPQAAGLLTLNRGILVMGDITANNPSLLTLNLTVAGGFITNNGFVRNIPWKQVVAPFVQSHVVGRMGMAIPVNTLGRIDFPVGSGGATPLYRPTAITFTVGNATIAPTTIICQAVDAAPTGTRFFPIAAGQKYADPTRANWIGSTVPYQWVFEALTPLGASQRFDVELNGSYSPGAQDRMPTDIYDTRVIYRFDGDVTQNGWFLSGTYGGNALYIDTPTPSVNTALVRNQNALGQAIAQRAIFTIGVPTQPPAWSSTNPATAAMTEATGTTLNTYTQTYTATDPDVVPQAITYSYAVTPALPAGATAAIGSTSGVFTFTPGWNGGTNAGTVYNFTFTATKADGSTNTRTLAVTVTNTNRPPDFTATGNSKLPATSTITNAQSLTDISYVAPDADGDAVTYALTPVTPAVAGTVTFTNVAGVGKLNFTPAFSDAGKTFTFTVTGTDVNGGTSVTTATVTVTYSQMKGDANLNGAVTSLDASTILQFVVGTYTPTNLPVWNYVSDVNMNGVGDGVVGAIDAAAILWYTTHSIAWPNWKGAPVAGSVDFGKLTFDNGNVSLPVNLTNATGVRSAYIEVELGNLEFTGVTTRSASGWVADSKFENGKLRIAMAGVEALTDGTIANITLKLKDKENVVTVQANASLNDQINSQLVAKVKEVPNTYALSQNYPNPFNPTTNIKYQLAEDSRVTLAVYNLLGQKVKTLVDSEQEAGYYTVRWDGTNDMGSKVSSGIYIYRVQSGNFVSTMKMNLLK